MTRYVTYRMSVSAVQTAYSRLERSADAGDLDERYNEVLDLSEREAANSAGVMNALLGDATAVEGRAPDSPERPADSDPADAFRRSPAIARRARCFRSAPRNPDAVRHFCTSAREVITQILELKAPDIAVIAAMPDCERTPQMGTPTRRAKIRYFLHLQGMDSGDLEEFVEADMKNVVELFQVFNEGTHGAAGAFDIKQLQAIRKRIEDGIMFLSRIVSQTNSPNIRFEALG